MKWTTLAIILCLPGGCLIATAIYLRKRWAVRAAAQVDALIRPPVVKFAKADDSVRERTVKRRKIASDARKRAAHVETGSPVSDILRAVK